ncbi:MAG: hypothetical protein SVW57_07810, partial [Thermodesulfobacteriota bacterium]|nr:hypothetical protein [Thermodesulfobacteriota bacterium]
ANACKRSCTCLAVNTRRAKREEGISKSFEKLFYSSQGFTVLFFIMLFRNEYTKSVQETRRFILRNELP